MTSGFFILILCLLILLLLPAPLQYISNNQSIMELVYVKCMLFQGFLFKT